VVQSPITAAAILVEMTAAHRMFLPLLATTIVAYEASRLLCPTSLYEALALAFLRNAEAKPGAP
jgi:H+/Cl- antiporter ClcA